jgi:hypothetical protein
MELKPGVSLVGIQGPIIVAMMVIRDVMPLFSPDYVITACTDGTHGKGSLHYKGLAIDVRIRNMLPSNKALCRQEIARRLGPEFDVVLEVDHLHVEFDPKASHHEMQA